MQQLRLRANPVKGKCLTLYCPNRPEGSFCSTCRSRKARSADPVRYAYNNLRNRAKQRRSSLWPNGIPFTITLAEFRAFCHLTQYIAGKGKTATSYSLDRIREWEGYHVGNIQVLPLGDNVRKAYLFYDWHRKIATVSKPRDEVDLEPDPF